jgi:hypothetical protein
MESVRYGFESGLLEMKARADTANTEMVKGPQNKTALDKTGATGGEEPSRKGSFYEGTRILKSAQEQHLQDNKVDFNDPQHASPPTQHDIARLQKLFKPCISRRGCYTYASLYYQKRVYLLMVPSVALSACTASLAGLGLSSSDCISMVAVMNAVNTLLMSALSLLKYQSKMDAALLECREAI